MDCEICAGEHVARYGGRSCTGHVTRERADENGYRAPLPAPRPCKHDPMRGQDVCWNHGGAARQNRAAGEQRMTEQRVSELATRWAIPVDTSPTEAILGRVAAFAGHVNFYATKVAELDDEQMVWGRTREKTGGDDAGTTDEARPNVWLVQYNEASDRLVKFAAEALRAGVEERRVRLAEQQGQLVAEVIRAVLGDLDLTPEQAARAAEAVPTRLRLLAS